MNTTEYLAMFDTKRLAPKMVCKDGFTMSVQASRTHYCQPRQDEGPWNQVEIGFPSDKEPLLHDWAKDSSKPTKTVYGYVPVEIVDAVIAKHGGLVL